MAVPSSSSSSYELPRREPLLFTPGPLTVSGDVKQAMLVDLGSRDHRFLAVVRQIRESLLAVAGVSKDAGYECILMQGSGTFAVESVIGSTIPPDGRILVASNGAYGRRICAMCRALRIEHAEFTTSERQSIDPAAVVAQLQQAEKDGTPFTHLAIVHHETTAGVINPVQLIGAAAKKACPGLCFVVDSMSGFGALPLDVVAGEIDYVVSSANKCIEGVPGFAFAVARREHFEKTAGWARSLSLDLHSQWAGLEKSGQFRFTPPTHALLAFHRALQEHAAEGGPAGRLARYEVNAAALLTGMAEMGFKPYLDSTVQGPIITTFLWPDDPSFEFSRFYEELGNRGFVIYPGKLTKANCFRMGTIGRLFESDIKNLVAAVRDVLVAMNVKLPVNQIAIVE